MRAEHASFLRCVCARAMPMVLGWMENKTHWLVSRFMNERVILSAFMAALKRKHQ